MIGVSILSLLLLAVAGVMIDSQVRARRRLGDTSRMTDRNRRYHERQFRRRMQANVMIGVVGLLVAVWPAIPRTRIWMSAYLGLLLIAVLWMVAMAMLDALAINRRFRRDRMEQIAEQARFALETQRKKLDRADEGSSDA